MSSYIGQNDRDRCIEWDKNSPFFSPQLGIQITLIKENGNLEGKVQYVSRGIFYKFLASICAVLGFDNFKSWGAKPVTNISETIDHVDATENWISKVGKTVRDCLDQQSSKIPIDPKNQQILQKIAKTVEPLLHTKPSTQTPTNQKLIEEKLSVVPNKPSELSVPTGEPSNTAEQESDNTTASQGRELESRNIMNLTSVIHNEVDLQGKGKVLTDTPPVITPEALQIIVSNKADQQVEKETYFVPTAIPAVLSLETAPRLSSEYDLQAKNEEREEREKNIVASSISVSASVPVTISETSKIISSPPVDEPIKKAKIQNSYISTAKKASVLFTLVVVFGLVAGWRMGFQEQRHEPDLGRRSPKPDPSRDPIYHQDYFDVCDANPFMLPQSEGIIHSIGSKILEAESQIPFSTPTNPSLDIQKPDGGKEIEAIESVDVSSVQARHDELSGHLASVMYNFVSLNSWQLIVKEQKGLSGLGFHYSGSPPKILNRQRLRITEALKIHFSKVINEAYTWRGDKEITISCTDYRPHTWLDDIFQNEGITLDVLNLPPKLNFIVSSPALQLKIKMEVGAKTITDTMHFVPAKNVKSTSDQADPGELAAQASTTKSAQDNLYGLSQTREASVAFANTCLSLVSDEIQKLNNLHQPIREERSQLVREPDNKKNKKRLKDLKWKEDQINRRLDEQRSLEACIKGAINGNPEDQHQYATLIVQKKWGNEPGFASFWYIEAEKNGFAGKDVSQSKSLKETSLGILTINSLNDVKLFSGRIVAYETDSSYFKGNKGYEIENIYFGYVSEVSSEWSGGEIGYNMARLLKPKDIGGNCALIMSTLKKSPISMRLATKEEIELIKNAIAAKQARFNYMYGKDKESISAILKDNLQVEDNVESDDESS